MKYLLLVLLLLGCNGLEPDLKVSNKGYKSEHYIHYFKESTLQKEYVPQKFYIFQDDYSNMRRCEVQKDLWITIKLGDIISSKKFFNCIYSREANIRVFKQ